MEFANRSKLPELLRNVLTDLSFGWDTKGDMPDPFYWSRPRLITPLSLSGHPLQPHLATKVRLDPDEVVDVYEDFITRALSSRQFRTTEVASWMRARGRLNWRRGTARMVFTPLEFNEVNRQLHLNMVQFAAVVSWNYPCYVESTETKFVVTTQRENYAFGIDNGYPVSNMPRPNRRRAGGLKSPTGSLLDIAQGSPVLRPVSTTFDTARAFLESNRQKLGQDFEAALTALNILWWRSEGEYPLRLLNMVYRETSVTALRAAVAEARNYEAYDRPLRAISQILVPQFMSVGSFGKLFGSPYKPTKGPPTEWAKRRWDRALDDIDPGPELET